jgi:hypothetical protein
MSALSRSAAPVAAAASSLLLCAAPHARAADFFILPNGKGGYNGYEVVATSTALSAAFADAAGRTWAGAESVAADPWVSGHVYTVRSAAQNERLKQILNGYFSGSRMWIGLAADDVLVPGSGPNSNTGGSPPPAPGQAPAPGQRGYGFGWQSGDPFTYQNFAPVEPNNYTGTYAAGETGVEMNSNGTWNDNGNRFTTAALAHPYVVEYELNLPARPRYAAPAAVAGKFNVRVANGGGPLRSNREGQALLRSGAGTVATVTAAVINFQDPRHVAKGRFDDATRAPFPGGAPDVNVNEDDFAMLATGIVRIATEGDYTFGFASDDGASLRVIGATFTATRRGAVGDTLSYDAAADDSNMLGVAHLLPGDYPIEFDYTEQTSVAFAELYAAKGAFTDRRNAAFHLIGDTANGGLELVAAPEPSVLALAGVAAASLLGRRRRGGGQRPPRAR